MLKTLSRYIFSSVYPCVTYQYQTVTPHQNDTPIKQYTEKFKFGNDIQAYRK